MSKTADADCATTPHPKLTTEFPGEAVPSASSAPAKRLAESASHDVDLTYAADPSNGEYWCTECISRVTVSAANRQYGHRRDCSLAIGRACKAEKSVDDLENTDGCPECGSQRYRTTGRYEVCPDCGHSHRPDRSQSRGGRCD